MRRNEIEDCIPHRPPFLWVDEVVEIAEGRIHARKYVDAAAELFVGHFPNYPILPGVLLCEAAFQAAAVWIARTTPLRNGTLPVVTRLNNTKFRHMVRPGDTLDIHVTFTERLGDAFFFTGKLMVDERVVARLEFACTTVTPDQKIG